MIWCLLILQTSAFHIKFAYNIFWKMIVFVYLSSEYLLSSCEPFIVLVSDGNDCVCISFLRVFVE